MKTEPEDKAKFEEQMEKNKSFKEAYELRCMGMSNTAIAKKFNVSAGTVGLWFRKASIPPSKIGNARLPEVAVQGAKASAESRIKKLEQEVKKRQESNPKDELDDLLKILPDFAIEKMKAEASEEEDRQMAELAQAQVTPADKYQHYIAAAAIKLLRDSMSHLRGPRTVKELSDLDQLIRRNLGLNAKGGGTSTMQIDISLLNNSVATKGRGAASQLKKDTIDADIIETKIEKTKKK